MFTTIRSKILAGFLALISLTVAFGLWTILRVNEVGREAGRMIITTGELVPDAVVLLTSLEEERRLVDRMLADSGREEAIHDFDSIQISVNTTLRRWRSRVSGREAVARAVSLDSLFRVFHSSALALRRDRSGLTLLSDSERRDHRDAISAAVIAIQKTIRGSVAATPEEAGSSVDRDLATLLERSIQLVLWGAIAAVILGVVGAYYYSRWVLRPIGRLSAAAQSLAGGRLEGQVPVTTADELGDLSFEFNRMVERLRAYDAINVEQLLVEKRKVEAILESLSVPIIVVDMARTIALGNRAAADLFRVESDQLRPGMPIDSLPVDDVVIETISAVLGHGSAPAATDDTRLLIRREEGIDRFYTFTALPLATTGGLRGVVAVFSDITHFKELDRLKSDFLARVSHELRTPLASITMSLDIMREGLVGDITEKQRELLEGSKEDCRRLTKLIQDLLELARIESRERPRSLQQLDPAEAVADALVPHQLPAREGGISLSFDVAGAVPTIRADREEIRWIINNLVGNALRHTPVGGSISVQLRTTERDLVLSVSDTGEGIPLDLQPYIFEKFHQVEHGRGGSSGSVGLGLAIVRDTVRLYNGTISLDSEPGRGTSFTIRLPLAEIDLDQEAPITS